MVGGARVERVACMSASVAPERAECADGVSLSQSQVLAVSNTPILQKPLLPKVAGTPGIEPGFACVSALVLTPEGAEFANGVLA